MSRARMGEKVYTFNGNECHILKFENGIRVLEFTRYYTRDDAGRYRLPTSFKVELTPEQAAQIARELTR